MEENQFNTFQQGDLVMSIEEPIRRTEQEIMPEHISKINTPEGYDIYPYFSLGEQQIFTGYSSLCDYLIKQGTVVIDGYVGVYWERIIEAIKQETSSRGLKVNIVDTAAYMKNAVEIDQLVAPYLGTADSVWGKKTILSLSDLFLINELQELRSNPNADINLLIGCGAALAGWDAALVYVDLPKNELQHRMNAGTICNLGANATAGQMEMYKRFYFVDWVLLNAHKKSLAFQIDVFADGQWEDNINWAMGDAIRWGLEKMSRSVFRARPWFAPGAWGGQWMKGQMPQLDPNEVNYAWSFELIAPENGIVLESGGLLLEVSFDLLMFVNGDHVLGLHRARFGDEFPIRFDFLDTFDGGNLSIQCHPSLKYIQENFGEKITQDETYYILDCKSDAGVYLGFQDDIIEQDFKQVLQDSIANSQVLDIEKYVQLLPAKKHELFLIPNGTVHSAGTNNLVLEISATPYIFTFKMYDWLRPDLNGLPRPINIEHAFNNLDFSRKGEKVFQELISKPVVLQDDKDLTIYHLPTHAEHFYDVHRLEFDSKIDVETANCCHVLMLVEGTFVDVVTADGSSARFAFAETFVVPAAAKTYTLINGSASRAKVVKAFLK